MHIVPSPPSVTSKEAPLIAVSIDKLNILRAIKAVFHTPAPDSQDFMSSILEDIFCLYGVIESLSYKD